MIDFPLIDTHVHLLDTRRFRYSWAANEPKLRRDWTPDDLTAAASPCRIESYVFVEVDVDMPQYLAESEWIEATSAHDPRLKGCVACLPLERGPAIEAELARLSGLRAVRGVRRLIQNKADGFATQPAFIAAVKLLPKYNFTFDICIYHHQLADTIAFVKSCPEVSFVLDHIAKPAIKAGLTEPWASQLQELASLPNVVCKISGVMTEADHHSWTREQLRPYIDHAIDCFGFDRVMYGGDWPVSVLAGTYAGWVDVLDWATAGCSDSERRKLFRDNGRRIYRLD